MRNKVALMLGVTGLFALLVLVYGHGFRTIIDKESELGTLYHTYRFWKPHSVAIDSNNDGKIDAIGYLRGDAEGFLDGFSEYFEDRDFDGHFEIKAIYINREIASVEVDRDIDGIPEEIYEGEKAAKDFFLQFVPKEDAKDESKLNLTRYRR